MSKAKLFINRCSIWLPPVLWALVIFSLSAQSTLPGLQVSIFDYLAKKSAHIGAYALLYFLVLRSIRSTYPKLDTTHWKVWLFPLVLCLLYAVFDEIHQYFVPNRTAALKDVGYDFIGMSLVFLRQYRYI